MTTKQLKKPRKHSDKIGELLKWSQIFLKLSNDEELMKHIDFILQSLTITQIKSVLLSGLLKCADDIEYNQIFEMQNNLKSYDISNDEKKDEDINIVDQRNEDKMDMVPNDIILNNICQCLGMNDIFNFSKCGRRYAIICHSPPAMNNFQLCINGNGICFEKNYFNKHRKDHHRLLGVKNLTINAPYLSDDTSHYPPYFFRQLKHVQHLTYIHNSFPPKWNIGHFANPCFQDLKYISFIDTHVRKEDIQWLLDSNPIMDLTKDFNSNTIYNLETIDFNNCSFNDKSMPYLCKMIFPTKNNKLSVLKLQNLKLKLGGHEIEKLRHILSDENQIRESLCNLRAFVMIAIANEMQVQNFRKNILPFKILSVLQFQLECIHIHFDGSIPDFPFSFLMQYSNFYQNGKQKQILHLKELCISFPRSTTTNDLVLNKICKNLVEDVFLTNMPKKNTGGLQKLCLVFPALDIANVFMESALKNILMKSTSLKLLQLNIGEEYEDCNENEVKDIFQFFEHLCSSFSAISKYTSVVISETAFVFRLLFSGFFLLPSIEQKSDFLSLEKRMIVSFLSAFPNGMFQWKSEQLNPSFFQDSFQSKEIYYKANENSCSMMNADAHEKFVSYDAHWICECMKCKVNTPWE